MKNITSVFTTIILLSCWIILSSWGGTAHRIINLHAPASFPASMEFLKTTWPNQLADHASDADYRKPNDPTEAPKHYIDIDVYSEFLLYGRIPQTFDSIINAYGYEFVQGNGILPWATISAFDTLKACFSRNDFNKAMLVASDLGHYVADGNQPLHITTYYDGKTESQNGIHSRYETRMINNYENLLAYPDDSAVYIGNVPDYIFSYLYENNKLVDSILLADDYAQAAAGDHSSSEYYEALWGKTGIFTVRLLKNASHALANLIFTAWVEAGNPNSTSVLGTIRSSLGANIPNPFYHETLIPFNISGNNVPVRITITDENGRLVKTLVDKKMMAGHWEVTWNASDCPEGIYFCMLNTAGTTETRKLIRKH